MIIDYAIELDGLTCMGNEDCCQDCVENDGDCQGAKDHSSVPDLKIANMLDY